MPYQQLHAEILSNTLPSGAIRNRRGVRLRTVVSVALATAGLGLGLGSMLTMAALTNVEAANRTVQTSTAAPVDMPPLPNFPVRGVSSGRRPHPYPAGAFALSTAVHPYARANESWR